MWKYWKIKITIIIIIIIIINIIINKLRRVFELKTIWFITKSQSYSDVNSTIILPEKFLLHFPRKRKILYLNVEVKQKQTLLSGRKQEIEAAIREDNIVKILCAIEEIPIVWKFSIHRLRKWSSTPLFSHIVLSGRRLDVRSAKATQVHH